MPEAVGFLTYERLAAQQYVVAHGIIGYLTDQGIWVVPNADRARGRSTTEAADAKKLHGAGEGSGLVDRETGDVGARVPVMAATARAALVHESLV